MTRRIIVLLLLTVFCTACNSRSKLERPDGMPELQPCSVTVTFGGNTLEGIVVSLIPLEDGSKWKPSGITDKNGLAVLSSSYGFKGVPEGKYTVAFAKKVSNPDYDEDNPKSPPHYRSLIPLKYAPGKSKETAEIKAGEKNEFSFALDAGEEFVR